MSRTVDERVVQMQFDNSQFERGAQKTLGTLTKLNSGLNFGEATKSLNGLSSAARNMDLSVIGNSVDHISSKFSALGVVGFTVMQQLTKSAISIGAKITNAITGPIFQGGANRALNIEKAKFQFKGLGMDVEKSMEAALYAVKGTAYGLDEAAVVASQFGASGMEAGDKMAKALRAVSGVAAMTGRSYSDIGHIFTTVSGNGRLMGMQLTQLSASGINAAAAIAKHMGTTEASVRDMVSKGKISFETFYQAMDSAFGEHATSASETYTGSLSNLRAALARIGQGFQAQKFENLRNIFNALTPVIDTLHEKIKPLINEFNRLSILGTDKLVSVINSITDFGGLDPFRPLVKGLLNVSELLISIVKPIKEAFLEIFPPKTKTDIYLMAITFQAFTEQLKLSETTIDRIKKIFAGLFSVLKMLGQTISFLTGVVISLSKVLLPIGTSVFEISSSIGTYLQRIASASTLTDKFSKIIEYLRLTLNSVGGEFGIFNGIMSVFSKAAGFIGDIFKKITKTVGDFLSEFNFERVFGIINSGLVAAVLFNFQNFLANFDWFVRNGAGIATRVTGILNQTRIALATYQTSLKANVLLNIAGALGILAVSLLLLSTIESEKMASSLTAITVLLTELMLAMNIFTNMGGRLQNTVKAALVMGAMTTALLGLSITMKILSTLDWNGVGKGLVSISTLLTGIVIFTKTIGSAEKGLVRTSVSMVIFAGAILILSSAVEKIGSLEIDQIGKGLLGIGVLLAGLVLFMKTSRMYTMGVKSAIGLLILSTALVTLSMAVKKLSEIPFLNMLQGLGGLLVILTGIVTFTRLVGDKKILATSIALLALSTSMVIFSKSIEKMGGMTLEELGKGLGGLALGLFTIAGAAKLMTSSLAGAAALYVMAISIGLLTPALVILGSLSIGTIAKSLLTLVGAFTVLGLSAFILSPLIIPILALAGALTLLGVATLAIGGGILALSVGLTGLAGSTVAVMVAVIGGITGIFKGIIGLIPSFIEQLGKGLILLTEMFTAHIPLFVASAMALITALLKTIADKFPDLIDSGVKMILAVLKGIAKAIPEIIDSAFKIIISFINGLATAIEQNAEKLNEAFKRLFVTAFKAIFGIIKDAKNGAESIGLEIMNGIKKGIESKVKDVTNSIKGVGTSMLDNFKDFWGIRSPSALAEKELGMPIMHGISSGITKDTVAEMSLLIKAKGLLKTGKEALEPSDKVGEVFTKGVAAGITEDISPEKAAKNKAKTVVEAFKEELSKHDLSLNVLSSESDLWSALNPNATTGEKKAKEVDNIIKQIAIQEEKVALATKKYNEAIKKYGSAHAETQKMYVEFNKERTTLATLSNQLTDIEKNTTKEYFDFIIQNGEEYKKMGYTAAEIEQLARRKTGYGMTAQQEVSKNMETSIQKTVASSMGTVQTVYNKTADNVFGNLTGQFDSWGTQYATAIGDGFLNAFKTTMTKIRTAVTEFDREVQVMLNNVVKRMQELASQLDGGGPVITPVLDMSMVQHGLQSIGGVLPINASVSANQASNLRVSKTNGNGINDSSGSTNINYTQNNYSPKALSRLEIYRQTNNQLSTIKGVMTT